MKRQSILLSLASLSLLSDPAIAESETAPWKINSLSSILSVTPEARLEITETLELECGATGEDFQRELSRDVVTPEGPIARLKYSGISGALGGETTEVKLSEAGEQVRLSVANTACREIGDRSSLELKYQVDGVKGSHSERDDIRFPMHPSDTTVSIQKSEFRLRLPEGVVSEEASAHVLLLSAGSGGIPIPGVLAANGSILVTVADEVSHGEGLDFFASWPRGYLKESAAPKPDAAASFRGGALPGVTPELFALLAELKQENISVFSRRNALMKIANGQGLPLEAVPQILEQLTSSDGATVLLSTIALAHAGPKAGPLVAEWYQQQAGDGRAAALLAIGYLGPRAKDQLPLLMQVATSGSSKLKQIALQAIGSLRVYDASAVELMVKSLSDPELQFSASLSLGMLRADESGAPLFELVQRSSGQPRQAALQSLANLSFKDSSLASFFEGLVQSPTDSGSLANVAKILGNSRSTEVVPLLIQLLDNRDIYTHTAAARGLSKIGGSEAEAALAKYSAGPLKALTEQLRSGEEKQRCSAAFAIGSLGRLALPALPVLLERLDATNRPGTCENALFALGGLDETPEIIDTLSSFLRSKKPVELVASAGALGRIGGPKAKALLNQYAGSLVWPLIDSLRTEEDRLLIPSLKALSLIDTEEAKEIVEAYGRRHLDAEL